MDKGGAKPHVVAIERFRPNRRSVPSHRCQNKKLMDPDMTRCIISESKLDKEYHEIMVMLDSSRHSKKKKIS